MFYQRNSISAAWQGLKDDRAHTASQMAVSIVERRMSSKVLEEWMKDTDPQVVPDIETLLEFYRVRGMTLPDRTYGTGQKKELTTRPPTGPSRVERKDRRPPRVGIYVAYEPPMCPLQKGKAPTIPVRPVPRTINK